MSTTTPPGGEMAARLRALAAYPSPRLTRVDVARILDITPAQVTAMRHGAWS